MSRNEQAPGALVAVCQALEQEFKAKNAEARKSADRVKMAEMYMYRKHREMKNARPMLFGIGADGFEVAKRRFEDADASYHEAQAGHAQLMAELDSLGEQLMALRVQLARSGG